MTPHHSALCMRSRTTLPLALLGLLSAWACLDHMQAQTPSSQLAAESERAIVRSQENLLQARALMHSALERQSQNNLKEAYELACESIQIAPSGEAARKERAALVGNYTGIALAYARKLITDGVFTDSIAEQNGILKTNGVPLSAESVAKSILDPSVNPRNRQAIQLLSDLEQPGIFNKTVTPKLAAQRDEVVRLLREAEGLTQSGRNDQAIRTYEEVLTIDPYNSAARKGMEAIRSSNMKYADEAYNETRARMLWQTEKNGSVRHASPSREDPPSRSGARRISGEQTKSLPSSTPSSSPRSISATHPSAKPSNTSSRRAANRIRPRKA